MLCAGRYLQGCEKGGKYLLTGVTLRVINDLKQVATVYPFNWVGTENIYVKVKVLPITGHWGPEGE